jgi:hypothetical protein
VAGRRRGRRLGAAQAGAARAAVGPEHGGPARLAAASEAASFPFAATVGERDFHYYEAFDLEAKLSAAGVPHRLEVFAGSHQWPPAEVVARAIGWLELRAMREGSGPRVMAMVEVLWQEELARTRALEEEAFAPLRDEPGFRALVERMRHAGS